MTVGFPASLGEDEVMELVNEQVAAAPVSDLAVISLSRSSNSTLGSGFTVVVWNQVIASNDVSTLEQSSTEPSHVDVKDTGIYLLTYTANLLTNDGNANVQSRVRINGSTVLAGSSADVLYEDKKAAVTRIFPVLLTQGSYVELQFAGSGNTLLGGVSLSLVRLQGLRGARGLPGIDGINGDDGLDGAGSNINLFNNGVLIPGSPFSSINFVGSSVSDVGGQATVDTAAVYGQGFMHEYVNEVVNSSTSLSNGIALSLSPTVSFDGQYEIMVTGTQSHDNTSNDFVGRLYQDGVPIRSRVQVEPQDSSGTDTGGTNQRPDFVIRGYLQLTAGDTPTFDFRFASSTAGVDTRVYEVDLTFKRVQ